MSASAPLSTERVVAVAADVADRDGLETVTLAAVAAELDVRTPSLYNHVDGLDDLRRRLARLGLAELDARLAQAAVGRAGDDAVRALAAAYRDFARRRPGLAAAAARAGEPAGDATAGKGVAPTVAAALAAYGLDEAATAHATRTVCSLLHGFTSLEAAGAFIGEPDVEATFAWLVAALTAGLGAHGAAGADVAAR